MAQSITWPTCNPSDNRFSARNMLRIGWGVGLTLITAGY